MPERDPGSDLSIKVLVFIVKIFFISKKFFKIRTIFPERIDKLISCHYNVDVCKKKRMELQQ